METHKNQAIERCQQLLMMLEEIEKSRNLNIGGLNALKKDKQSIQTLEAILSEAETKEQVREAWVLVNLIKHEFAGYIGGEAGTLLENSLTRLLQAILDLL